MREALARSDAPGAPAARRDFAARGLRSDVYLALVRRLAEELEEEFKRSYLASLN